MKNDSGWLSQRSLSAPLGAVLLNVSSESTLGVPPMAANVPGELRLLDASHPFNDHGRVAGDGRAEQEDEEVWRIRWRRVVDKGS
jgi:hypothetical protein